MMHCVWLSVSWSPSLSFLVVERWRPLYLYIWKTLQPHWYACKTIAINVFISHEDLHFLCVTQTLKSGIYPAMKFCKCYKYRNWSDSMRKVFSLYVLTFACCFLIGIAFAFLFCYVLLCLSLLLNVFFLEISFHECL